MKYRAEKPGEAFLASSKYSFYLQQLAAIFGGKKIPFAGWGRKRSGRLAIFLARLFRRDFLLLEDGFIRSIGLGVDSFPSFSAVEDNVGIYYDATRASRLENILSSHDFKNDTELMRQARRGIALIKEYQLSKYNSAPALSEELRTKYTLDDEEKRILVIIQTAGDASLRFGFGGTYSTEEMLDAAVSENPGAVIYAKIHPDVLNGKKRSDIDIEILKKKCRVIDDDIAPLSLLAYFDKVYTKTSQMGFEAILLERECVCFGMPFYAGWGVTDDRISCERRKRKLGVEEIFAGAYLLYSKYFNPYSQKSSDLFDTIETITKYKDRDKKIDVDVYCFGFSYWKHTFMMPFLRNHHSIRFINPIPPRSALDTAIKKGMDRKSRIYIWGKKQFDKVEQYAKENHIAIYRVEDGFIRSVGLGSDLTRPYSLVIDSRGIYFDPTRESDLEHILNFHRFTSDELSRAKQIREWIIQEKISKYNSFDTQSLQVPKDKKIILVPGQVEDDASIRYGAPGMTNLKLLLQVREQAPEAYIIYKPHPDVLAGNRIGRIDTDVAMRYCDCIVEEISLDSVLAVCDELHTMTSLVGFEAIIRGIKVYTYGLPFYAGWGLSVDKQRCERRKRDLTTDELVTAALLLYPRYINPITTELCEPEVTLKGLKLIRDKMLSSFLYRKRAVWQSRISRKVQWLLRKFQHNPI